MSSTLQRTDDWYAARLGKVTASRVADVIARTKTGWGASRQSYMDDLIVERITGQPPRLKPRDGDRLRSESQTGSIRA